MSSYAESVDRLHQACLWHFGRQITYWPQAGAQSTVLGIFSATQEAEDSAPGVYAVVFLRSSDLSAPPQRGDWIIADGKTYKVYDVEADVAGGAILRLRRE